VDIVAHTLWAAAGAAVIHRSRPLTRRAVVAMPVLAVLPKALLGVDAAQPHPGRALKP